MLSYTRTYKDEPSAHGRCKPRACRSARILSDFRVGALTSKGRSVRLLQRHRGWILRMASFMKREKQYITVIPSDSHSGFYFPPPAKGWRSPFLSRTGNLRAPAPINSNSFCEISRKLSSFRSDRLNHLIVCRRLQ